MPLIPTAPSDSASATDSTCCSQGSPLSEREEQQWEEGTRFKEWIWTAPALEKLPEVEAAWRLWAAENQVPPAGDWRVWMLMGGRGAGKTRAGAEWVRALVAGGVRSVALVGPTLHDVREVMIEGPSGLKAVAIDGERPVYEVSRRRLRWPNGAVGHVFSAEDPDSLRGPQIGRASCRERVFVGV